MEKASLARRIIAYLVDAFILFILLFLSFILFYSMLSPEVMMEMVRDQASLNLRLPLLIYSNSIIVGYFTIFESSAVWNATPGKRAMNIEVVSEYRDVTFSKSFLRNITRILWSIPCIGLIILGINIILIADSDRRMGDWIADTDVVMKSSRLGYSRSDYRSPDELEWLR